jgi:pimeloyl-ACP methyl ester carboxylesterase
MRMKTTVIYIPGLGDGYDGFRKASLRTWRLWGVRAVHVPITWYDGQPMNEKLTRIRKAIDRVPRPSAVVLVGESAGATLALHEGEQNERVTRVITLCGVARSNTPISSHLRSKAPALDQAVRKVPESYTVDVHSIRAAMDAVVGNRYSTAAGASVHVIWTMGHLTTIVACLTILAPIISTIAKKQ